MPNIGTLAMRTRAQFAARTDSNCSFHLLARPTRSISYSPVRMSPRSFLQRRAPCPPMVSLADTFVNFLVIAGTCKKHSPPARAYWSASVRSTAATEDFLEPVGDVGELDDRSTPTPIVIDEKPTSPDKADRRNQEAMKYHNDMTTRAPVVRDSRPLSQKTKPSIRTALLRAFGDASKIRGERHNYNIKGYESLLRFYVDVLGYEKGIESFKVVLSNPKLANGLPPTKRNDHCLEDDMSHPAVARIVPFLEEKNSSHLAVYRLYRELPPPGVAYLSERSRGNLLHLFSKPPRPRRIHALRYLRLIDDMCKAKLHISPGFWHAAIHVAGKCAPRITESELYSAIDIWNRMEREGGYPTTSGVLNILFDIAIKAGQFKFADKFVTEMENRGVDFSRFGRLGKIHARGLLGDADGVREAYHEFIREGEVVDTVVLNCVMVSLIRSGRHDLAEQMYERMRNVYRSVLQKNEDEKRPSYYPHPFDNYAAYRKASNRLGISLGLSAFLQDKLPDQHRTLQSTLPLTPDAKTFHIFLSYNASESGDLERFVEILRDMEVHFEIPPQGMVYLSLFRGFAKHGGKRKTEWTFKRLQNAWEAFLRAVEKSNYETTQRSSTKNRIANLTWENPVTGQTKTATSTPSHEDHTNKRGTSERTVDGSHIPWETGAEHDEDEHGEDADDWNSENKIYLGREILVSCLHAYSVCGGRGAVIDLWEDIERHWYPEHPRPSDVIAVKKVLWRLTN